MEKDPRCYVECNVDVGERERERDVSKHTHMTQHEGNTDKQIDRQKMGRKEIQMYF